jgi:hypothetical protein
VDQEQFPVNNQPQQNYQQPYQQSYQQPYQQNYQQPYQQNYQQPYYGQPYQPQAYGQIYIPPTPIMYAMPTEVETEPSSTATTALVFSFLIPIVGLIMGIVGLTKYKSPRMRNKCTAAIVISITTWIIAAFIIEVLFSVLMYM